MGMFAIPVTGSFSPGVKSAHVLKNVAGLNRPPRLIDTQVAIFFGTYSIELNTSIADSVDPDLKLTQHSPNHKHLKQ